MLKREKTEPSATGSTDARLSPRMARVWDPLVRAFHWSLVLNFAVAWLSAHSSEDIHYWAGLFAAVLIGLRLAWGVVGSRHARFSDFVSSLTIVWRYLRAIIEGRETRYIGHNPAGGAMVLALMAAVAATALTGWLMTTDAYFGVFWIGAAHDLLAHGLLLLAIIHIGGVALASIRHRENLVFAMITGMKRK